ncbi:hypothetical protein [Mucilaginibacter sp.]|jgi:hypothetical protein|uniref:hypothetical protein n=1 Tax=Mucilaginibacter sp. TaxID=1882438 RepID=UPI00356AEA56
MAISLASFNIKKWKNYADWKLLVLLLLFLNVKLAIKIPAIALVYLLQFDFKFGFGLKNSRLPLFYLLIIVLALTGFVINQGYQNTNYIIVFLTGIFFWLLCILAIHQVKLSVEKQTTETLHRTLLVFFIINSICSALNLLSIVWETGAVNPYLYQGQYQKYFISTGDYIKGVTFDTSTTNAVINAIGVIYFLVRKKSVMLLVCMATLILSGSNILNIVLLLIMAIMFAFKSTREQKSMIIICLMMLVVFMAKISPQNNQYVDETLTNIFEKYPKHHIQAQVKEIPIVDRPDSVLTPDQHKEKIATLYLDSLSHAAYLKENGGKPKPVDETIVKTDEGRILIPQANIHSASYQSIKVPLAAQHPLITFIDHHKSLLPFSAKNIPVPTLPGKAIGLLQTGKFMLQNPGKILLGDGIGNFSSKLAFRATGLGFAGGFPKKYTYINREFMLNHLDLYLNFFSKNTGYHSLTNSPFSVYDQLWAEYGLLGLLAFAVCYLWFFARHYQKLTYGIPVLLLVMAVLFIDYWFEQLSILIFFELIMLLNIKETSENNLEGLQHA